MDPDYGRLLVIVKIKFEWQYHQISTFLHVRHIYGNLYLSANFFTNIFFDTESINAYTYNCIC